METPVISDQAISELMKRLDTLGAKLGVTAQFIFSIYVRQAFVQGIEDIGIAVLTLVVAISTGVLTRKLFKYGIEDNSYDDWPFVCGGLSCIVTVASFIAFCTFTYSAIGEFLNPQFWALQSIFQAVK